MVYHKSESLQMAGECLAPDLLVRLRQVADRLPALDLTSTQAAVLHDALEDLLHDPSHSYFPSFTLRPFVCEELRRLPDHLWPRYLIYRYRYEVHPAIPYLDRFPPCLQIEPTSVCNYRCTFCYQTDDAFTKKSNGHMGFMTLERFQAAVDEAQREHCEAVTLASRGEPLLHPDIVEMLFYLRGRFVASKLNTNAWFLDEVKSHALLQADLNTLVLSVEAVSEPTYSQFRVGGKLEKVVENIKRFAAIKRQHYPDSRTIVRVSGVKVPGTPSIEDMEAFWGQYADQVAFVTYNPWENTYEQPKNDLTAHCSDLWRRMFVWWDGTVNPCDVDYKSTLAVGQFPEQSLSDLWMSEPYMRLRGKHLASDRKACSPCQLCTVV